jgi:hypothetical protein
VFGIVKKMREQAIKSVTNGARSLKERAGEAKGRKQSLSDLYEKEKEGTGSKTSLWSGVKAQVGKTDSHLAHYRHERVAAQCVEDVVHHSISVEQKLEKLEELWPTIVRKLVQVVRLCPWLCRHLHYAMVLF